MTRKLWAGAALLILFIALGCGSQWLLHRRAAGQQAGVQRAGTSFGSELAPRESPFCQLIAKPEDSL
jgi:hypothetical protein